MYSEFVCKEFVQNKIDGFQVIVSEEGIHALKVPNKLTAKGLPFALRALDYDLVYFGKSTTPLDLRFINTNVLMIDYLSLNKDIWKFCQDNNVNLHLIYYTSYKKLLKVTPNFFISNTIGDSNMVSAITVFLDTPSTQDELIRDLHGTTKKLIIYSTLKGILQLDPLQMAQVLRDEKKELGIENTAEPDPIFQNCVGDLQNEFIVTIIAKNDSMTNWEFERMAIEGNVMFYKKTPEVDIFPNRANNYDRCDLSLPTILITNSKYDLQLCYNLYLYEEYLKIYFEILGGDC